MTLKAKTELVKGSAGFGEKHILYVFQRYAQELRSLNPLFFEELEKTVKHIQYHLNYMDEFGQKEQTGSKEKYQILSDRIAHLLHRPQNRGILKHVKDVLMDKELTATEFHSDSVEYQKERLVVSLLNFALSAETEKAEKVLSKKDYVDHSALQQKRKSLLAEESIEGRLDSGELGEMEKSLMFIAQMLEKEIESKIALIEKEKWQVNYTLDKLRRAQPDLQIDTNFFTRNVYATDASDLHVKRPMAVFFPRNNQDILNLIDFVQQELQKGKKTPFYLVPQGGGTGLTGGGVPLMERTMVISMQEMCNINAVEVDKDGNAKIWTQAGANTKQIMDIVAQAGYIHAVDPASHKGCTAGGNLANGAGGPSTFELGASIDNVLEYKQILPDGTQVHAIRMSPPQDFRGRIDANTLLEFRINVSSPKGQMVQRTSVRATEIRRNGLAKDVMNKVLGGIPGIQKEGTDGVITDICWALHSKPKHQTTFLITAKHLAIGDDIVQKLIALRKNRQDFRILKLEQWDQAYAQVIAIDKLNKEAKGMTLTQAQRHDLKSLAAESTFVIDLGTEDLEVLAELEAFLDDQIKQATLEKGRACVLAEATRDEKVRAELWEDRHKLKAISAHTNGFKINEDFVIPIQCFKEFDRAFVVLRDSYQTKWQQIVQNHQEEFLERDLKKLEEEYLGTNDLPDLNADYQRKIEQIKRIHRGYLEKEMVIAYHAHYGDGNIHVNIPLYSQFPEMVKLAYDFLEELYEIVHTSLYGSASGEHGIGLAKKDLVLDVNKDYAEILQKLKIYRQKFDPNQIWHPGALDLGHIPIQITPSHQIIADQLNLQFERVTAFLAEHPEGENLLKYPPEVLQAMIETFEGVRKCMRCGACRPTCSYYRPEMQPAPVLMSPREKNMRLRAWFALFTEHLIYDEINLLPTQLWLDLADVINACSECGKCADNCSAGIDTRQVVQKIKRIVEMISQRNGNIRFNPLTSLVIDWILKAGENYPQRLEKVFAGLGVGEVSRKLVGFPQQKTALYNAGVSLGESLDAGKGKGALFAQKESTEVEVYFPGCAENYLEKETAQAVVFLLLEIGKNVLVPTEQICCGHPAEFKGYAMDELSKINAQKLNTLVQGLPEGIYANQLLISCGSCRKTFEKFLVNQLNFPLEDALDTIFQCFSVEQKTILAKNLATQNIGYKVPCHTVSDRGVVQNLEALGADIQIEEECCGMRGDNNLQNPVEFAVRTADTAHRWEKAPKEVDVLLSTCSGCTSANREVVSKMKQQPQVKTVPILLADILNPVWRKKMQESIKKVRYVGSEK